jgi:stage II sporulation protein AA (anti-sigma F factor antagonist)
VTNSHEAARYEELPIDTTTVGGVRVVTVRGEIDDTFRTSLQEALLPREGAGAAQPPTVLDLSEVTFMDSSGINVLILARQAVGDDPDRLRLAGPQAPVLRVMQLVGVDTLIPCHPTLREALEACGAG